MIPNFKMSGTSGIYLDNAAATRMHDDVLEVMKPYMLVNYGNPSSPHSMGRYVKNAMEEARTGLSTILKCDPNEIFYTSGGTESNNWAVNSRHYDAIISSVVEHPSVTKAIKPTGATYEEIPVDDLGMVDMLLLEDALIRHKGKSVLVSIQHANSETGTIQKCAAIGELAHKYGAVYHVDAVQSFCKFNWQVYDLNADMISISARKIHGPFGIGALYVSKECLIDPFIYGGGQERGMRSGTPDVASIVGFTKAAQITSDGFKRKGNDLRDMCKKLHRKLDDFYEGVERNGNLNSMLPNILNVTIPDIDSNLVCAILDSEYNLMASTGSACSSKSGPSKTLTAMGKKAKSSFRISLGLETTIDDMCFAYDFILNAIRDADEKLRV